MKFVLVGKMQHSNWLSKLLFLASMSFIFSTKASCVRIKSLLTFSLLFFVTSCTTIKLPCSSLASISITDSNGISETISNEERLKQYDHVNFLCPQPYKKVLRVYKRNEQGSIVACITTYHANGELKQYLEVINGRAYGEYGAWYENGVRKVQARVIGGPGDLYENVEKCWLFEGCCYAYNEDGQLEAEIPYFKGKREGTALYYHKNGTLWKEISLSNDLMEGPFTIYFDDGTLFERANFINGKKEGAANRYWLGGATAADECFEDNRLVKGRYYSMQGSLVSEVNDGNGFKAIFSKDCILELQEYRAGVQEGIVRVLNKNGSVVRTYGMKEGQKHGTEIEYDPVTKKPKLSIDWVNGKVQGLCKTWFANGNQESQREMSGNKKMGILTAWYRDGTLMMIENYEQDKLVKGEYYKQGLNSPVSTVLNGEGEVTLFDSDGHFLRKIKYQGGKPED